jgi:hypothetical protein
MTIEKKQNLNKIKYQVFDPNFFLERFAKLTKAERIYRDTKYQCRKYVETWGYDPETESGFTRLIYKDSESVSTRTVNAVDVLLKREKRLLEDDVKMKIGTPEENNFKEKVLMMVRGTLNNHIRNHTNFDLYMQGKRETP